MALRKELVAQRLAQLRAEHHLTQEQAAAKVEVNLRQWQRWEAGDSMPYPRNLDVISSSFGISIEEFFNGPSSQLDRIESLLTQLVADQSAHEMRQQALGEALTTLTREVAALRDEVPQEQRRAS